MPCSANMETAIVNSFLIDLSDVSIRGNLCEKFQRLCLAMMSQ